MPTFPHKESWGPCVSPGSHSLQNKQPIKQLVTVSSATVATAECTSMLKVSLLVAPLPLRMFFYPTDEVKLFLYHLLHWFFKSIC